MKGVIYFINDGESGVNIIIENKKINIIKFFFKFNCILFVRFFLNISI